MSPPATQRAAIVRALIEGNSVRSTCRITGAWEDTVRKLLREIGEKCGQNLRRVLVDVPCACIQCDEIWSCVGAREKHVTPEQKAPGCGDAWQWTAIDADAELLLSWHVGRRDVYEASIRMEDLASRLANRAQLTTDANRAQLTAAAGAFGWNGVDDSLLVRLYGEGLNGAAKKRYSSVDCIGTVPTPLAGSPDPRYLSASFVESSNLTIRIRNRRFTRFTNVTQLDNHNHAVSLFMTAYNFVHVHHTLTKARAGIRATPAMAAGVTDRVWNVEELLAV